MYKFPKHSPEYFLNNNRRGTGTRGFLLPHVTLCFQVSPPSSLQLIISTLQDSIMHQHSDSLHAAVLHVPQLHKVPPQLYRSSCSLPRRQGDILRVCHHCRRDRNISQIRSHSQITIRDFNRLRISEFTQNF